MLDPVKVERAEAEIDKFVSSRSKAKDKANAEVDLWRISEIKHREKLREQHRWDWIRYFECLAANHRGLSEQFEAKAAKLQEGEA